MILRATSLVMSAFSVFLIHGSASAALTTYFTPASYNAAVSALGAGIGASSPINFDSESVGGKGNSYSLGGVTFTTSNPTPALAVNSGTTSSASNFLGVDGGFGEFVGGDTVTLNLPNGTRAVSLNIVSDSVPDFTNFGSLAVGATNADTDAAFGQLIGAGPFRSYFLGIVGSAPVDAFTSATVSFTGSNFYRIDDVRFAAIPEPTSLMLLGTVGALGLMRRRRK